MYKFIIVDDEPVIRRGILKKINFESLPLQFAGEAPDAEDALDLIQNHSPDIIITDMRMPLMDGADFLKLLQREYPGKKVIVISGFSDFRYTRQAIEADVIGYLLKPFTEDEINDLLKKAIIALERETEQLKMLETLEHDNSMLQKNEDIRKLTGIILNPLSFIDKDSISFHSLGRLKFTGCYLLSVVYCIPLTTGEPDVIKGLNCDPSPFVSLLFFKNPAKNYEYFLLAYADKLEEAYSLGMFRKIVQRILDDLNSSLSCRTTAGISMVKTSLKDLHQAYNEALFAIGSKNMDSLERVFLFSSSKPHKGSIQWHEKDRLLFFIETCNTEMASKQANEFFTSLESNQEVTLESIRQTLHCFFEEVVLLLQKYNISNTAYMQKNFDILFDECLDLESLKQTFLDLLFVLSACFRGKSLYSSPAVIEDIRLYIERNYNKELSLDKLASMFFISPSYLSFLFKEKLGFNYVDYIGSLRIEKARELLGTSGLKIAQIASAVGYDNEKYFYKIFKKHTGCTPQEYRDRSRSK